MPCPQLVHNHGWRPVLLYHLTIGVDEHEGSWDSRNNLTSVWELMWGARRGSRIGSEYPLSALHRSIVVRCSFLGTKRCIYRSICRSIWNDIDDDNQYTGPREASKIKNKNLVIAEILLIVEMLEA